MDCWNNITGTCKDSGLLRFYNDMKTEVMDKAICLGNVHGGAAAPVLIGADALLEPLGCLLLAVTVTYIPRL